MRRLTPALLVLAPFVLALIYALLYEALAPTPTVETVVPERAIYVQRYRDIDALDATFFRHPNDPASPAERISEGLNIPGFPGLDRRRPIHLVFLPRGTAADSTLFILPLVREDALRARFDDPEFFLERGQWRRAKHLGIRGDFAGISGDANAVEHLGEGGLTAEPLGETFAIAVRVPEMVDYAAQTPGEEPWAPILAALGVGADDIAVDASGAMVVTSDRLMRVRGAWRTARLWAFADEGRIRIELEPTPGPLADLLQRLAAESAARSEDAPAPPRRAQAWVSVPGALARAVLARALYDAGLAFPRAETSGAPPAAGAAPDDPGPWADPSVGGGLALWASAAPGTGYAWTLGIAGKEGSLLDLARFLPGEPSLTDDAGTWSADLPVAEGRLALTLADRSQDRVSPAGRIVAWNQDGMDVLLAGPGPERARADFERGLAEARSAPALAPPPPPWTRVLDFGLDGVRARSLLGNELERGGLFASLSGGRIEGEVTTDGNLLRIEAAVVRPR